MLLSTGQQLQIEAPKETIHRKTKVPVRYQGPYKSEALGMRKTYKTFCGPCCDSSTQQVTASILSWLWAEWTEDIKEFPRLGTICFLHCCLFCSRSQVRQSMQKGKCTETVTRDGASNRKHKPKHLQTYRNAHNGQTYDAKVMTTGRLWIYPLAVPPCVVQELHQSCEGD